MPWKRPSSQPTSCACAIRSSASDGVPSSVKGSESRSSSSTSSGARPASSSLIEARWISLSRSRLASSSGADRTSSSSWRIMLPIRITFAGCSIWSRMLWPSSSASAAAPSTAEAGTAAIGFPSGPMTRTCCSGCSASCSLMAPPYPDGGRRMRVSDGEQDLAAVLAGLHQRVRGGCLGQRERPVHDRLHQALGHQRPDVLDDRRADRRLLLDRPAAEVGRDHRTALAQQLVDVELGAGPALHADDHEAALDG